MEESGKGEGMDQAKGVCLLLRQDERFLAPHQGCVRIPQ
jgi:hypothetical protein